MKYKLISFCLFFCMLLSTFSFTSCGSAKYDEKQIFAMDTVIEIKVEKGRGDEIFPVCEDIIRQSEKIFSSTLEDSEVYKFNEAFDRLENCSEPFITLLKKSLEISEATDGCFDITVAPLVKLWNITGENPHVPTADEINNALSLISYDRVGVDEDTALKGVGTQIDMGGIAKGYTLEAVCDYIESCGVKYAVVSFGGNIGTVGKKPSGDKWSVGVKNPFDTSSSVGTLSLDGGFVAVSGDYERYFEKDGVRYHHIFDSRTGFPAKTDIHSVAVICDDGALSDGLSTALFVMGYDKAIEFYDSGKYDFEAVFVTDDGVYTTEGIKENFTLA